MYTCTYILFHVLEVSLKWRLPYKCKVVNAGVHVDSRTRTNKPCTTVASGLLALSDTDGMGSICIYFGSRSGIRPPRRQEADRQSVRPVFRSDILGLRRRRVTSGCRTRQRTDSPCRYRPCATQNGRLRQEEDSINTARRENNTVLISEDAPR